MAFVVNVLLNLSPDEFWCDELEDLTETCESLERINEWIPDGHLVNLTGPTYVDGAGYGMHAWLFGGGFKSFPVDGFINVVEKQTWKSPGNVQLFMKVEGEDAFTLLDLNLNSK